jgi:hypothetical protein
MNTPDAKTAGATPPPAPTAMPVERLVKSLQPEQPLVINTTTPGAIYTNTNMQGGGGSTQ